MSSRINFKNFDLKIFGYFFTIYAFALLRIFFRNQISNFPLEYSSNNLFFNQIYKQISTLMLAAVYWTAGHRPGLHPYADLFTPHFDTLCNKYWRNSPHLLITMTSLHPFASIQSNRQYLFIITKIPNNIWGKLNLESYKTGENDFFILLKLIKISLDWELM